MEEWLGIGLKKVSSDFAYIKAMLKDISMGFQLDFVHDSPAQGH